ncbi:uncharacterized protein [Oscarella lobularis]|uniref:uncharacterized protein n=1 Tax=Oscarella lobularis TaxID=121494 RepID=UPI003313F63C
MRLFFLPFLFLQCCAVQDDLKAQIILEQAEKMFRDGFAEISEGFAKVKTSITFSEADTNGNGLVEASELAEHFAVSEEKAKEWTKVYDIDRKGGLFPDEFDALVAASEDLSNSDGHETNDDSDVYSKLKMVVLVTGVAALVSALYMWYSTRSCRPTERVGDVRMMRLARFNSKGKSSKAESSSSNDLTNK